MFITRGHNTVRVCEDSCNRKPMHTGERGHATVTLQIHVEANVNVQA